MNISFKTEIMKNRELIIIRAQGLNEGTAKEVAKRIKNFLKKEQRQWLQMKLVFSKDPKIQQIVSIIGYELGAVIDHDNWQSPWTTDYEKGNMDIVIDKIKTAFVTHTRVVVVVHEEVKQLPSLFGELAINLPAMKSGNDFYDNFWTNLNYPVLLREEEEGLLFSTID
jgi:hypothetical protein